MPPGSLAVRGEVSESSPGEAGGSGPTLTCRVGETVPHTPAVAWAMMELGPLVGDEDIVIQTFKNATIAVSTLSFSRLHTSHAGLYYCQGTLVSPAVDGGRLSNSTDPIAITVTCKWSLCLTKL